MKNIPDIIDLEAAKKLMVLEKEQPNLWKQVYSSMTQNQKFQLIRLKASIYNNQAKEERKKWSFAEWCAYEKHINAYNSAHSYIMPFEHRIIMLRSGLLYMGIKYIIDQNDDFKEALFATQNKTLAYAVKENIYGIGHTKNNPKSYKRSTWEGTNLLGETLTEIRVNYMGYY